MRWKQDVIESLRYKPTQETFKQLLEHLTINMDKDDVKTDFSREKIKECLGFYNSDNCFIFNEAMVRNLPIKQVCMPSIGKYPT